MFFVFTQKHSFALIKFRSTLLKGLRSVGQSFTILGLRYAKTGEILSFFMKFSFSAVRKEGIIQIVDKHR